VGDDTAIQRNRRFFRTVNLRLLDTDPAVYPGEDWRFFCECGAPGCRARVDIARDEMTRFSSIPACRIVAPGHAEATDEVIVRDGGYLVVADGGA
jgi:hypothetical protein